jgi:putative serine protease PepD
MRAHDGAMSASLFSPPDYDRPDPPEDRAGEGSGAGGGHGAPPVRRGRWPRRRRLAALLAITALVGGGVGAGLVAATGGGDSTTTIIEGAATPAASVSNTSNNSGGLNAKALYAAAAPGVVDITAKGTTTGSSQPFSPFGGGGQQSQTTATGTGFVVDQQGHIVTAAHVVNNASSVTVTFADGTTRSAKVLGQDNATDVAVLQVDNTSGLTLHPLRLASSASLGVGDQVAAIGDPFGYARSLSTGIFSGVDRTIQAPNGFTVAHAIQTDAALNPGNSGGPVLNAAGQVVGIVDQIATNGSADQSSGVGFAVPSDIVSSELSKLEAGQHVGHAYLGVETSDIASTGTAGVPIAGVSGGGPAGNAGLRTGDVVTKIGNATIKDQNDLVAAIATHQPGDRVPVTVRRGSHTVTVTVTLGTQPTQTATSG